MNIELRPGQVSETVTVSAEAPVVDVQSVTQQRVMGRDLLDTIPTGQTVHNMAALIPGMVISVTGPVGQDVGGSTVRNLQQAAIHGGRTGDQRVMMDGLPLNTSQGNLSGFLSNMASTQEFTIDTSGVSAEDNSGGVRMNIVPREGGNTFRGSVFFTGATDDFQSSNYDDHLASMGFKPPNPPKTIRNTTDFNASFGGPVKRDKLWFYTAFSMHDDDSPVAGRPELEQDRIRRSGFTRPIRTVEIPNETQLKSGNVRMTWQATTGNKIAFYYDHQDRCLCPEGEAVISTESISDSRYPGQKFGSATWTSVLSPKLLLDVAFLQRFEKWGDFATDRFGPPPDSGRGQHVMGMTLSRPGRAGRQQQHEHEPPRIAVDHHRRPRVQSRIHEHVGQARPGDHLERPASHLHVRQQATEPAPDAGRPA